MRREALLTSARDARANQLGSSFLLFVILGVRLNNGADDVMLIDKLDLPRMYNKNEVGDRGSRRAEARFAPSEANISRNVMRSVFKRHYNLILYLFSREVWSIVIQ